MQGSVGKWTRCISTYKNKCCLSVKPRPASVKGKAIEMIQEIWLSSGRKNRNEKKTSIYINQLSFQKIKLISTNKKDSCLATSLRITILINSL